MTASEWVDCPSCGAHLKADALRAHRERVHARYRALRSLPLRKALLWTGSGVLLVAGAILLVRLGAQTPAELADSGDPVVGSPDAPLTVFLFEDYQCPYCRVFELNGGWDHLNERWVSTGQVRVVMKDLAFISEDSVTAAEASQCIWARDPDAWPGWKRMIFENQGPERSGWARAENLVELTRAWGGTDADALASCLDDHAYRGEVQGDVREADEANVHSTPTLVVAGERITPDDEQAVDRAIGAALASREPPT